jgi:7-cyano-7-deazaguanine synthase in queuosine biosynthesis
LPPLSKAIPMFLEGEVLMAHTSSNAGEEPNPQRLDAEDEALWAAARQAVYIRKRSMSPQEATAVCLDRSAASHHRIAAMYEEIAERTSNADECRECASRHRAFAKEDRRRAAELRSYKR